MREARAKERGERCERGRGEIEAVGDDEAGREQVGGRGAARQEGRERLLARNGQT